MHSCLLSTCYLPVTRNVHITSVLAHRRGMRVRGFQITHRKSQPAGKEGRMPKVIEQAHLEPSCARHYYLLLDRCGS